MVTIFDVLTTACFSGSVIIFFQFTDRSRRTLLDFILAALAFALANQLGDNGEASFAAILILAGVGYVALVSRPLTRS